MFKPSRTRQIIRYRATATLRRPQIKQYTASNEGVGGYKTKSDIHVHVYMWRHIVLYGTLDVIEKILLVPPVECIEGSQTIPIFIIPFQEYSNENIQLISLTAINDEAPYRIRVSGSGCSEEVDTQNSSHMKDWYIVTMTRTRVPCWASIDHWELVVAPCN